jgi:hypothetical protein
MLCRNPTKENNHMVKIVGNNDFVAKQWAMQTQHEARTSNHNFAFVDGQVRHYNTQIADIVVPGIPDGQDIREMPVTQDERRHYMETGGAVILIWSTNYSMTTNARLRDLRAYIPRHAPKCKVFRVPHVDFPSRNTVHFAQMIGRALNYAAEGVRMGSKMSGHKPIGSWDSESREYKSEISETPPAVASVYQHLATYHEWCGVWGITPRSFATELMRDLGKFWARSKAFEQRQADKAAQAARRQAKIDAGTYKPRVNGKTKPFSVTHTVKVDGEYLDKLVRFETFDAVEAWCWKTAAQTRGGAATYNINGPTPYTLKSAEFSRIAMCGIDANGKRFTALEPDAHYNFFSKINVEA